MENKAKLRFGQSVGVAPHIREYIHLLIAVAIGLGAFFGIAPANGLTEQGVTVLAIVLPTIYLWLFVNTHWVSLLFLGLLAMTEIMTPNQVWSGALGHFAITLVLAFSILSNCLNDTGAIKNIANWFITRKFVQGRPYAFMAMFFASNLVIGMFMQNLALAVMYVALTAKICENLGLKKGDSLYNAMMLGTFWGNGVLSIASPIAKTLPNILIGLVYSNLGVQITYGQWFAVGIPFSLIMFAIIMLCIRLANPDTTPLKRFKISDLEHESQSLSLRGKIALIGMLTLILIILLPEILVTLGVFVPVASYFVRMGATVPAIAIIILLSVLKVRENGEVVPVLDFAKSTKNVPINLLLFVAAVVIMGVPMAAEASGIVDWIHNLLNPVTQGLPAFGLVVVLTLISVALTNFLSNTVVLTLTFHLGAALLAGSPYIGPIPFAVLIAFASCMACLTPSAVMTAPLYYGPEHLKAKVVAKNNLIFLVLAVAVIIAMTPLVISIF
ncbi:MAG: SLC13 family permease [Turicibacter sp.]|nr:SLC13 family permease [Turicibacter sp.]